MRGLFSSRASSFFCLGSCRRPWAVALRYVRPGCRSGFPVVGALAGLRLHKSNFRRLVESQGLVEETGELAKGTGGRPARLLRYRTEVLLERPVPGVRLPVARSAA